MELVQTQASEINWILDFSPRSSQPSFMPLLAIRGDKLVALNCFDRKASVEAGRPLDVLVIDAPVGAVLAELWPIDGLATFERLRFKRGLRLLAAQEPRHAILPIENHGEDEPGEALLAWPLEMQTYLDDHQLALKSLRALHFLEEYKERVTEFFLAVKLTSSQCREAIDLLCDLKMAGISMDHCAPPNCDGALWLMSLKKSRFPKTARADQRSAAAIKAVTWPRGMHAKWERHGDQGGIVLQTKISNLSEWTRLREQLQNLELDDSFWKI